MELASVLRRRGKGDAGAGEASPPTTEKEKADEVESGSWKCRYVRALRPAKEVLGFDSADFRSWESFVALTNRPTDPSNLAVFRICFG